MTQAVPRLPRSVESDPRAELLRRWLAENAQPLRPGGALRIATTPLSDALASALQRARSSGRVVRGLETAEQVLAVEEHGQRLADRRGDGVRGARVSRLLLLTSDGADRFHRQVEALLRRHTARVLAIRVDADADTLGALLFGAGRRARLVLLEHKEAVAEALRALVGDGATSGPDPMA